MEVGDGIAGRRAGEHLHRRQGVRARRRAADVVTRRREDAKKKAKRFAPSRLRVINSSPPESAGTSPALTPAGTATTQWQTMATTPARSRPRPHCERHPAPSFLRDANGPAVPPSRETPAESMSSAAATARSASVDGSSSRRMDAAVARNSLSESPIVSTARERLPTFSSHRPSP